MKHIAVKLIVILHLLWAITVLACLPLAFLYPHLHKAILWFIGFTLVAQIPYLKCPLTVWENRLRGTGDAYEGTCFKHYLKQWLGVASKDWVVQTISTIYFVVTILVAVFYKLHTAF